GRDIMFLAILAFMMIPYDTLMIPLYKIMVAFKWTNTYMVLTIPYFVHIFGIFLMRQFFMDLPDDYLEAAEIDGCGQFRTFWSVAMPMARASLAALCIFLFMAVYNSYLWPLISVNSQDLFTLPVGVAALMNDRGNQFDLLMAASSMIVVPVCIVFACAQKNFIEGITMGGVKG
ncbi:MAG: carbohydrate ABC transporter permease, partial [Oscillospiraceae bacterium]